MTGKYQAIIPNTITLAENTFYWLQITAIKEGVGKLLSCEKMLAVYHSKQYENSENDEINYLFIDSDNLITYEYLINNQTEEYLEDATVTMTLTDEDEEIIEGASELAMEHIS